MFIGAPADAGPDQAAFVLYLGYDADGNRTSVSTRSGTDPAEVTTLTYDLRGQVRTVETPGDTATYGYHDGGRPESIDYANGTGTAWAYDYANTGHTVTITHTDPNDDVLAEGEYGYDLRGNRVSESVTIGGQTVEASYGYDAVDRLRWTTRTDASAAVEHSIYSYDRYDRSIERRCADSFEMWVMESALGPVDCVDRGRATRLRRLEHAPTGGISERLGDGERDADPSGGSVTSADHRNMAAPPIASAMAPVGAEPCSAPAAAGRGQWRPAPSPDTPIMARVESTGALRIGAARPPPGDVDLDAFYDGLALVAERAPGDAELFARYHYDDGGLHAVTAEFAPDVVSTHTVHRGALGSTLLLTDGFGAAASSYRTDPWGRLVPAPSLDDPNALVFTGHQHDAATGLIYMKSRMYDPALGAFLTQDSYLGRIDLPASLHRYLYAYGNPGAWVDPDGRENVPYVAPGGFGLEWLGNWVGATLDQFARAVPGMVRREAVAGAEAALGVSQSFEAGGWEVLRLGELVVANSGGCGATAGYGSPALCAAAVRQPAPIVADTLLTDALQERVTGSSNGYATQAVGAAVGLDPESSAWDAGVVGGNVVQILGAVRGVSRLPSLVRPRVGRGTAAAADDAASLGIVAVAGADDTARFASPGHQLLLESSDEAREETLRLLSDAARDGMTPDVPAEFRVAAQEVVDRQPSGVNLFGMADGATGGVGRSGALNQAKRDLGIPRSQHPDSVSRAPMTRRDGSAVLGLDGRPVMTREYTYTTPDGSVVVVQDHSSGHQFGQGGVGDQGAHFNVRPPENTRTGSVSGSRDHYPFNR
jgi:RHS repeat-associated protein